jgi:hypothetical protein
MKSTLDLSISGFVVQYQRFGAKGLPRIDPTSNSLNYTASSVAVGGGTFFEPPSLWDVQAYCTPDEMELTKAIWAEHCYLRRTMQACDILVVDKTQLYSERAPRTRAIAPATEAKNRTGTVTQVQYYAVFQAWMPQEPKYQPKGADWLVTFTLQESARVEA